MSLTDKEIRDLRERLEATPKAVLVDEAIKHHRDRDDSSHHVNTIKRDKNRAEALQAASIKELDAWFGRPVIRELILALWYLKEAGEALSASVTENTMRVSRPDSSRDEGAPTRTYRNLKRVARIRVERAIKEVDGITTSIGNDMDRDEHLSTMRRFAAHRSNHGQGRHTDKPHPECDLCEEAS